MSSQKDITSTEKLLDVIRGNNESPKAFVEPRIPKESTRRPGVLDNLMPFRRKVLVGIELGYREIRLVMTQLNLDRSNQLLKCLKIPVDSNLKKDSPEFAKYLKSVLAKHCGPFSLRGIWSVISAADVDIRYLKLPKVTQKQLYNAVYWAFKKAGPTEEENVIFDFEQLEEIVEDGVKKIPVIAYTAPQKSIQEITRRFHKCGYPLTGVTTFPFAIQNLLRKQWIQSEDADVCTLFIGRNISRIDIYSNKNLMLSRDIRAGTGSMVLSIMEGLNEKHQQPAAEITFSTDDAISSELEPQAENESVIIDEDQATRIFYDFIEGKDSAAEYGSVFEFILPALDRLISQIDRTFEHYAMNFKGRRVSTIHAMGETAGSSKLLDYMKANLGMPVKIIDPFPGSDRDPDNIAETFSAHGKATFTWTLGLGIAGNQHTPNFIYTHRKKELDAFIKRVNLIVFSIFASLVLIFGGCFWWQKYQLSQNQALTVKLRKELSARSPRVDRKSVAELIQQVKKNRTFIRSYSRKYIALALVNEIVSMTPEKIKLINLSSDFPDDSYGGNQRKDQKQIPKSKAAGQTAKVRKLVVLEGIVTGSRKSFETTLAGFVFHLQESRLLDQPRITSKSIQEMDSQEVLHFKVQMDFT